MTSYDLWKSTDESADEADERETGSLEGLGDDEQRQYHLRQCIVCGSWTQHEDGWGYAQCRKHAERADARMKARGW